MLSEVPLLSCQGPALESGMYDLQEFCDLGTLSHAIQRNAFQPKAGGRWSFDHTYVRQFTHRPHWCSLSTVQPHSGGQNGDEPLQAAWLHAVWLQQQHCASMAAQCGQQAWQIWVRL